MSRFIRFDGLSAYVPGEQPQDMRYIKLNTNESPFPPSPGVIKAISELEISRLNLYPNPEGSRLLEKLAARYGVEPENVVIGNGSDELLAFAFLAFCDKDCPAAFPDITYGFYPVYAALYGIETRIFPLRDDFTINSADYRGIGGTVVLPNPNAPTGIALPLREIEAVAESNPGNVVIIDEAYVDFGAESAVPLTRKYENLLVIHTFSKSRSMAGARLAYAIGPAPLVADLNTMKYSFNPYNVNRLTQLAGEAALIEDGYNIKNCAEIAETRAYTSEQLKKLGFEMTDSAANFVFVKHPGIGGFELYRSLKERGILVRHFAKPRITDWLRITIGTREQMDVLLNAVKEIIGGQIGENG